MLTITAADAHPRKGGRVLLEDVEQDSHLVESRDRFEGDYVDARRCEHTEPTPVKTSDGRATDTVSPAVLGSVREVRAVRSDTRRHQRSQACSVRTESTAESTNEVVSRRQRDARRTPKDTLGLSLAQPSRRVLVVTGDGEMLMGIGALATIATARPTNLAIAVIDNERYGETGMQRTHTAAGVDIAGMATAAGFVQTCTVLDDSTLAEFTHASRSVAGPLLGVIKVATDKVPLVMPPRDGALLKDRFREAVLGTAATN